MRTCLISITLIVGFISQKCSGRSSNNYVPSDHDSLVSTLQRVQHIGEMFDADWKTEETYEEISNKNDFELKIKINWHLDTLKCGYLNDVLMHMLLTYNLFMAPAANLEKKLSLVLKYKDTIQDMIAILYGLGSRGINGFWLPYVYMTRLEVTKADSAEIALRRTTSTGFPIPNVALVHMAIVKRLSKILTFSSCGGYEKNNLSFDDHRVTECSAHNSNEICMEAIETQISKNIASIKRVMGKHRDNGIVLEDLERYTTDHVFIYDIVESKDFMNDLINNFIVEIDWQNVPNEMIESNKAARSLNTFFNGTRDFTDNQKLFLNFVKLIIVRLTRKHLAYQYQETKMVYNIASYSKIREKKLDYSREIIGVLENFVDFFQLIKEDELTSILDLMREYVEIKQTKRSKMILSDVMNFAKTKETEIVSKHFYKTIKLHSLAVKSTNSPAFKLIENFARQKGINVCYVSTPKPIDLNLITMKVLYKYFKEHSALANVNFGIITAFYTSNDCLIV